MRLCLDKLYIESYRNFRKYELETDGDSVVLVGPNGVGKTNILEAISLIFPGRGIRGAKLEDIIQAGSNFWFVDALMQSKVGVARIHTRFDHETSKRSVEFNGSKIQNSELSKLSNILWLTPQMHGIFLGPNTDRRRFLDRIIYGFYRDHASNLNKYEHYIHERIKILRQYCIDFSWLKIVESKIAELIIQIAADRLNGLMHLQKAIDDLQSDFPKAILEIDGIELQIMNSSGDMVEFIQDALQKSRDIDRISGRTSIGVHRSNFMVKYKSKNINVQFCSTGEQKAILITIIIAQIISIINTTSIVPILLLDEIFVHLDEQRRNTLIDFLVITNAQMWITSTEQTSVKKLTQYAKLITLN